MAAGAILIKEDGGVVSCVDGQSDPLKTGNLICGNELPGVHVGAAQFFCGDHLTGRGLHQLCSGSEY
jgi:hypothetical protein